jgi:two-component system response regulator FixJ
MSNEPAVYVVDDDPGMREAIEALGDSVSLPVRTFGSAVEFLNHCDPDQPGCLVLDVRLPAMSGLDLQQELPKRGIMLPVIVVTGHGDVGMAVRAVKAGALDFLEKPFRSQEILDRINEALRVDKQQRALIAQRTEFRRRQDTLTPREREVMELLLLGDSVKEVAAKLDISPKTVQIHRSRVMDKMNVDSVVALLRLVAVAGDPSVSVSPTAL